MERRDEQEIEEIILLQRDCVCVCWRGPSAGVTFLLTQLRCQTTSGEELRGPGAAPRSPVLGGQQTELRLSN